MQAKGMGRKKVLSELKKIREQDLTYKSGHILGSMCTAPHPTARFAHQLFLGSNLGDSGLFQGSLRLEKEVIEDLAALLNAPNSVGFIVSGGTEANLMALLAARNMADVSNPEVVLPESAHFSFTKICNLLKLKAVHAKLDNSYRVDPVSVEKCVGKNTVAIIGTAGTAELGVVDPIDKLSEIALKHHIYLHVDAALGGLIIPFMAECGYSTVDFDFRLDGVKSITVDPHKMGMATIPSGGILFRDRSYLDCLRTETPYLTEQFQYTFVGTRPGASAAATWAGFKSLGREGFTSIVDRCLKLTEFLASRLEGLGFELVTKPTLNLVAFRSSDSRLLALKLRRQGWFVSYVPRLNCIRIVVMPHVRRRHLVSFLTDLSEIAKAGGV